MPVEEIKYFQDSKTKVDYGELSNYKIRDLGLSVPYTYTLTKSEALKLDKSAFPYPIIFRLAFGEPTRIDSFSILGEAIKKVADDEIISISLLPQLAGVYRSCFFYLSAEYVMVQNFETKKNVLTGCQSLMENIFTNSGLDPELVYRIVYDNVIGWMVESVFDKKHPKILAATKIRFSDLMDDHYFAEFTQGYYDGFTAPHNYLKLSTLKLQKNPVIGSSHNAGYLVGVYVQKTLRKIMSKVKGESPGDNLNTKFYLLKIMDQDSDFEKCLMIAKAHNTLLQGDKSCLPMFEQFLSADNLEEVTWHTIYDYLNHLLLLTRNLYVGTKPDHLPEENIDVSDFHWKTKLETSYAKFRMVETKNDLFKIRLQVKDFEYVKSLEFCEKSEEIFSNHYNSHEFTIDVRKDHIQNIGDYISVINNLHYNLPSDAGTDKKYAELIPSPEGFREPNSGIIILPIVSLNDALSLNFSSMKLNEILTSKGLNYDK